MVADQFRKDYRQLTAEGIELTVDDIVRLNALMIKVERSRNAANTVHLPRLAFLGDLTLREPTIAHEMWIEQASHWIPIGDARTFDIVYAYALSRLDPRDLPDAFDGKKTIRKVFKFAAKKLVTFTRAQLSAAVDYCLFGADWTACERPAAPRNSVKNEGGGNSPTLGLLAEARAMRLPITLDDAKTMTASELDETIRRALVHDHKVDFDSEHKRAFNEYRRTVEEIRKRFRAPKAEEQNVCLTQKEPMPR